MLREQISMCLSPDRPIIDIWKRIQNGRRIAEKIYWFQKHIRDPIGVLNKDIANSTRK